MKTPANNKQQIATLLLLPILTVCIMLLIPTCKKGPFSAVKADIIALSAASANINPGTATVIYVEGTLANGKPMPDETPVLLFANYGYFKDAENKTVEALLLFSGKGQVTYVSDPTQNGVTVEITAKCGDAVSKPEKLLIAIKNTDISKLSIAADPGTIPVQPPHETIITVTAVDLESLPVAGKTIFLTTTAGTISFLAGYAEGKTDSDGLVQALLQTDEAATVTATYKELKATLKVGVGVNVSPTAAFEFSPQNPESNGIIYFTSNSTDADGYIVSWDWNFGDGKRKNGETTTHSYDDILVETEFRVQLTVTDNDGATGTIFKTVKVKPSSNKPPVAAFTFSPASPKIGERVYFISQSTDEDGYIETWQWYFGDGGASPEPNPDHLYHVTEKTVFNVQLTVTDDGGKSTSVTKQVTIGGDDNPPKADFTFSPTNPRNGDIVYFDAGISSGGNSTIVDYNWNFGDGTTGTGKMPQHSYVVTQETTFTVTLTITTSSGLTSTKSKEVPVKLQ